MRKRASFHYALNHPTIKYLFVRGRSISNVNGKTSGALRADFVHINHQTAKINFRILTSNGAKGLNRIVIL